MDITVIGTGYVGLVNGVCMAANGGNVTCVDIDEEKIERLKNGELPIYEKLLEPMMRYAMQRGNLKFSTDYFSVDSSTVIFICVGTPENADGSANLDYVFSAVDKIIENTSRKHECVVVVKSTVPVGTTDKVKERIDSVLGEGHKLHVAFNPEFLKEGIAVSDCAKPDRVILGLKDEGKYMTFEYRELHRLYEGIMDVKKEKIVSMDIRSAEMVKYASNAMLATRISFINEIANLCEAVGANVENVSKGVGLDSRIGPSFLKAGCGYGGSCFPKDVKALMKTAEDNGQFLLILGAVNAVNDMQKDRLYQKYTEFFNEQKAAKACVLGLSFKPGTDDMREAPSINLINDLIADGVKVTACDPAAVDNAKKIFGSKIEYTKDPMVAVSGASVVFLVTEWDEFKNINVKKMYESMAGGKVVIDGRNMFNKEEMEKIGFQYDRIG